MSRLELHTSSLTEGALIKNYRFTTSVSEPSIFLSSLTHSTALLTVLLKSFFKDLVIDNDYTG